MSAGRGPSPEMTAVSFVFAGIFFCAVWIACTKPERLEPIPQELEVLEILPSQTPNELENMRYAYQACAQTLDETVSLLESCRTGYNECTDELVRVSATPEPVPQVFILEGDPSEWAFKNKGNAFGLHPNSEPEARPDDGK